MNLKEYALHARKTSVYPRHTYAVLYPILGLGGESGEVCGAILKDIIDGDNTAGIKEELGDVLWYIASAADDLGKTLEDIEQISLTVGIEKPHALAIFGLRMVEHAGRAQEHVKKAIRKQVPYPFDMIGLELAMVLGYMRAICVECGFTMDEVAQGNIDKLSKRKAQGQLTDREVTAA